MSYLELEAITQEDQSHLALSAPPMQTLMTTIQIAEDETYTLAQENIKSAEKLRLPESDDSESQLREMAQLLCRI